jgi:hypothetical protein
LRLIDLYSFFEGSGQILMGQAVHQIEIERRNPRRSQAPGQRDDRIERLDAAYGLLHLGIEGLHAEANIAHPRGFDDAQPACGEAAGVKLQRDERLFRAERDGQIPQQPYEIERIERVRAAAAKRDAPDPPLSPKQRRHHSDLTVERVQIGAEARLLV